jgi:hydroxymethylpyrimidine pyrophosphatase-like HAD family hydrolase
MMNETFTIAVDFDGTIVEDKYPKIGKPKVFAFETLKKLQERGHRLILWTVRRGRTLDEAVSFCENNGITFYAINRSYPEEEYENKDSRKVNADLFIDDRNIGGLVEWGEIYINLIGEKKPISKQVKETKKGWFSFLKK